MDQYMMDVLRAHRQAEAVPRQQHHAHPLAHVDLGFGFAEQQQQQQYHHLQQQKPAGGQGVPGFYPSAAPVAPNWSVYQGQSLWSESPISPQSVFDFGGAYAQQKQQQQQQQQLQQLQRVQQQQQQQQQQQEKPQRVQQHQPKQKKTSARPKLVLLPRSAPKAPSPQDPSKQSGIFGSGRTREEVLKARERSEVAKSAAGWQSAPRLPKSRKVAKRRPQVQHPEEKQAEEKTTVSNPFEKLLA